MKEMFCFLIMALSLACGSPSSSSHNGNLTVRDNKTDIENRKYDASARVNEVFVVDLFMGEVVKTKNYAKFNYPVVEEVNNLFILDLEKYLSNLRRVRHSVFS